MGLARRQKRSTACSGRMLGWSTTRNRTAPAPGYGPVPARVEPDRCQRFGRPGGPASCCSASTSRLESPASLRSTRCRTGGGRAGSGGQGHRVGSRTCGHAIVAVRLVAPLNGPVIRTAPPRGERRPAGSVLRWRPPAALNWTLSTTTSRWERVEPADVVHDLLVGALHRDPEVIVITPSTPRSAASGSPSAT